MPSNLLPTTGRSGSCWPHTSLLSLEHLAWTSFWNTLLVGRGKEWAENRILRRSIMGHNFRIAIFLLESSQHLEGNSRLFEQLVSPSGCWTPSVPIKTNRGILTAWVNCCNSTDTTLLYLLWPILFELPSAMHLVRDGGPSGRESQMTLCNICDLLIYASVGDEMSPVKNYRWLLGASSSLYFIAKNKS